MTSSPIDTLIRFMLNHIKKHPFIWGSFIVHILIFLFFFYCYSYQEKIFKSTIHTEAQRTQVSESVEKTTFNAMKKHVENLEKIESLLAQSTGKQSNSSKDNETTENINKENLIEKANKLAQSIEAIRQDAKAEELKKLLNISKEEALTKVKAEKTQEAKKTNTADKNPNAALALMELNARKALEERKSQLEHQDKGTAIKQEVANDKEKKSENNTTNSNSQKNGSGDGDQHGKGSNTAQSNIKNNEENIGERISQMLEDEIPLPENLSDRPYFATSDGYGEIPSVENTHLLKNTGVSIGASGEFSNRFFVNNWYIIGPFSGNPNRIYNKNPHYPPEDAVILDAVYEGSHNRLLTWEHHNSSTYPVVPNILEEDSVYYGYTELKFDEAQNLWAWIGADDGVEIWLNNQLVYAGSGDSKQWFFQSVYSHQQPLLNKWNLTETKKNLHFKKGKNTLFFKLANGPKHVFFSLILTREEN